MLPLSLVLPLRQQIARARVLYGKGRLHQRDAVKILCHKISLWAWVFPSSQESIDSGSNGTSDCMASEAVFAVFMKSPHFVGATGKTASSEGRHDVPAFFGAGSEHVANADVELRGGVAGYRNAQAGTAVVAQTTVAGVQVGALG